jgi:hypothetical protein
VGKVALELRLLAEEFLELVRDALPALPSDPPAGEPRAAVPGRDR